MEGEVGWVVEGEGDQGGRQVLAKLWGEGGLGRLYRGLIPALIQAPLAR